MTNAVPPNAVPPNAVPPNAGGRHPGLICNALLHELGIYDYGMVGYILI